MEEIHTLYIQRGSVLKSTFAEWGIVCTAPSFVTGDSVKDLPSRSWPDEHGDDTYMPQQLRFEAFDADFEFAYKGEELASNPFDVHLCMSRVEAFKRWLAGNNNDGAGTSLSIYSPYTRTGRRGCYLKKFSDKAPLVQLKGVSGNTWNENVVTFKVTFRVTDPMTEMTFNPQTGITVA